VRLRSRRRTVVVWSSSSGRVAGRGVQRITQPVHARRIPWWLRTGALLTIIGVMLLARTVRTHLRPAISLTGTAITVTGISLPSGAVIVSGILVLLLALFLPSDPATAPAKSCSARLWALPLTPFAPSARHQPPRN
jgi:hypothetical protein